MGEIADAMIEAETHGYAPEDFADYLIDQHFGDKRGRGAKRHSISRHSDRSPEAHPVACEGCKRRFKRTEDQRAHALATGHPSR